MNIFIFYIAQKRNMNVILFFTIYYIFFLQFIIFYYLYYIYYICFYYLIFNCSTCTNRVYFCYSMFVTKNDTALKCKKYIHAIAIFAVHYILYSIHGNLSMGREGRYYVK